MRFLIGKWIYIIDAIDTVTAKLALVEICKAAGYPDHQLYGTGNKLHPELFEITDISKTSVCPLCKVMRKELKERGIKHLKVLYSKENRWIHLENQPEKIWANGGHCREVFHLCRRLRDFSLREK